MKTIFWDFDGVILDSMPIRDKGFKVIFKDFDTLKVSHLLDYHKQNGGLSRYVKIRYFFEEILQSQISQEKVMDYANDFSNIMLKNLINPKLIIEDSMGFIRSNHNKYNFHIVSGSDQDELRTICKGLDISRYFKSIHGSPKPKTQWVKELLEHYNYTSKSTCLIGDSINDYEAATQNKISFYGYNNQQFLLKELNYISSFKNASSIFS